MAGRKEILSQIIPLHPSTAMGFCIRSFMFSLFLNKPTIKIRKDLIVVQYVTETRDKLLYVNFFPRFWLFFCIIFLAQKCRNPLCWNPPIVCMYRGCSEVTEKQI